MKFQIGIIKIAVVLFAQWYFNVGIWCEEPKVEKEPVVAPPTIARAAQEETALDRLRVAVTVLTNEDKEIVKNTYKTIERTVEQKVADGAASENAARHQYLVDYIVANKTYLEADPANIKDEKVIEMAFMLRYALDNGFTWDDWRKYEPAIVRWTTFLNRKRISIHKQTVLRFSLIDR